jgi:Short C-terminal domain
MPGLLRGVARTAVVAGTATAVSNRVSRRQANRWAGQGDPRYGGGYSEPASAQEPQYSQEPAYAPPAPPPPADPVQALKDLAALHEQGVLTDAEFSAQKARILSS